MIERLGDDLLSMHTDYVWSANWFLNALFVIFLMFHRLLPTFKALRLDFAATKRRFAVFGLTYNMLVNKNSGFLALGFLTGDDVICTLGLLYVTPSGLYRTAESVIYYIFFW